MTEYENIFCAYRLLSFTFIFYLPEINFCRFLVPARAYRVLLVSSLYERPLFSHLEHELTSSTFFSTFFSQVLHPGTQGEYSQHLQ